MNKNWWCVNRNLHLKYEDFTETEKDSQQHSYDKMFSLHGYTENPSSVLSDKITDHFFQIFWDYLEFEQTNLVIYLSQTYFHYNLASVTPVLMVQDSLIVIQSTWVKFKIIQMYQALHTGNENSESWWEEEQLHLLSHALVWRSTANVWTPLPLEIASLNS